MAVAKQVAALPAGRYAPMFALTEEWFREKRRLPPDEEPLVPKRLAGKVPELQQLEASAARVSWGVELGARYRDAVRAAKAAGAQVDAWQLDEVVPSAAAPQAGRGVREFTRGVLRGLLYGRPVVGDGSVRGLCLGRTLGARSGAPADHSGVDDFLAHPRPCRARVRGRGVRAVRGRPACSGPQLRVRAASACGQRPRPPLAGAEVRPRPDAGLQPGGQPRRNIHGWPRAQVNAWRAGYVQARARSGVAGFAEFNFHFANSSVAVMHDVLSPLAAAF